MVVSSELDVTFLHVSCRSVDPGTLLTRRVGFWCGRSRDMPLSLL